MPDDEDALDDETADELMDADEAEAAKMQALVAEETSRNRQAAQAHPAAAASTAKRND